MMSPLPFTFLPSLIEPSPHTATKRRHDPGHACEMRACLPAPLSYSADVIPADPENCLITARGGHAIAVLDSDLPGLPIDRNRADFARIASARRTVWRGYPVSDH